MITAVDLFNDVVLDELAQFAANNRGVGPRWAALHGALMEWVLPARDRYRAALDAAAKDKAVMEARHRDAERMRPALVEQLSELDRAISTQHPAERAAAKEAPARIAAEANESVSESVLTLVEAALQSFVAFRV